VTGRGDVPTEPSPDLLAIAHLLRPWGNRGRISAVALAPPVLDPNELVADRRLYLRADDGTLRTIQGLGVMLHKGRWMVALEGIESISDAETLRGLDLCLPRAELPPLPDGWHWEADLLRCRAVDARLGDLGGVEGLDVDAPQPQLIVRRPDGSKASIPWVKAYLKGVDLAAGEIRFELPEGFPGFED
jgi:16S rRNA processing protein RimM